MSRTYSPEILNLFNNNVNATTYFCIAPPPVNKVYALENGLAIYDINNNYARTLYGHVGYSNTAGTNSMVYYSSGTTNYGIRIDSTTNSLKLLNLDVSGATYINCNTGISTSATTGYYISSICISNKVLYIIATGKLTGTYPSNVGTGINVFSVDITSINLATAVTISLTLKASVTTGSITLWNTTNSRYFGVCTMDNNNNLYITTFNSGIYVFNTTDNSLIQFISRNYINYSYNSVSSINQGAGTNTVTTSNVYNAIYDSIAYNSSSNSLFLGNVSNPTGEHPIDVININKVTNTLPFMYFTSGYFKPPSSSRINTVSSSQITFDSNNNLYFTTSYTTDGGGAHGVFVIFRILCFKEDTQILTYDGYKLIQDLRKGDLVKTSQNGYKPIYKIGHSKMTQQSSEERIKDQLYKCSTENFPEVFEDLVLTGCHCILVDKFKDEKEREEAKKINMVNANDTDDDFITENKYRLPACIDERTTVYEVEGEHTIYHFALENDDYYMNYGVYANGLLVESTSKRFMDQRMINELE